MEIGSPGRRKDIAQKALQHDGLSETALSQELRDESQPGMLVKCLRLFVTNVREWRTAHAAIKDHLAR